MGSGTPTGARRDDPLERWRADLAAWAIPDEILAQATESPWGFPVGLFQERAGLARSQAPTPSNQEALRHLPPGGTVLDVGAGAGAGSMPLAGRAGRLVAVDESAAMLAAFRQEAGTAEVEAVTVEGRWPDVADRVEAADVAVCHHVLYNVADLEPFVAALTSRARHRVVAEISDRHPQVGLGPLWRRFHGLERPDGPSADDAEAALRHLGLRVKRENWEGTAGGSQANWDVVVAFTRRRLCLPPGREAEVAEALEEARAAGQSLPFLGDAPRRLVTLSWSGR
jgi:SAM-dependent methyltransferase